MRHRAPRASGQSACNFLLASLGLYGALRVRRDLDAEAKRVEALGHASDHPTETVGQKVRSISSDLCNVLAWRGTERGGDESTRALR